MNSDIGSVAIIAIIMVVLFCVLYDPGAITYVILAILILFALAAKKPKKKVATTTTVIDIPAEKKEVVEPPSETDAAIHDAKTDESMAQMSEANRWALDQLYGRRGTPIDDRMTEHHKRIGSREEKAIVTQIRARRNNSMEPFYRQELSQHGNKRWWDPDPVLARKATPEQQATLMKGPGPNWS